MTGQDSFPRAVRTYVLRQGRMTDAQRKALDTLWPDYGLSIESGPVHYDELFSGRGRRVAEIGFGMGDTLVELARQEPESGFIGIEVHRPGVGRLLQRLKAMEIRNVRVFCADALEVLQRCIPSASLDAVLLLFPDPWPKKKHQKRRIVQPDFVNLVSTCLRPGGLFHLATDWEPYAVEMMRVLEAESSLINRHSSGQYSPVRFRPETKFERRGARLGHAIWDLEFEKRS